MTSALTILPDDMFDAVPGLVGNIPINAKYVAGYVDSVSYTWPASAWNRFPNAVHVTISTRGLVPAMCGDREPGDLSASQAYDLYVAGKINVPYCSFGNWGALQDEFRAAGTTLPPAWWIAEYPGGGRVLPQLNGIIAAAHQYASSNLYDLTCITPLFLQAIGVDDMPLSASDISAVAAASAQQVASVLLNWYINTPDFPVGTSGRQIKDVMGDGERLLSALSGDTAADKAQLSALGAEVLAAIKAQPTGGQVDVPTLVSQLAGPFASALAPLLPPGVTAAQVAHELGAALSAAPAQ